MKKLVYSLIVAFLMVLSANSFAQKAAPPATMAYINTKTSKKVVDDKTAIVSFQLNNITNDVIKDQYKTSFAKQQRVQSVTATMLKGNMASFSIKMDKVGTLETLQKMFTKFRIGSVNVDGEIVATKDLLKLKNVKK